MRPKKVGILTAGGLAPCLSASIGKLINEYHEKYPKSEMIGYLNGYKGLLLGNSIAFSDEVKVNHRILYNFGGSPIGNSRVKLTNVKNCVEKGYVKEGQLPLEVAAKQLVADKVDILHTIGGDDTNTTAADLANYLKSNNYALTVVGLPKTVDNDVYPIKQTLGAWTAAEQGALFFRNIANENTTSSRNLIIHEIMGRNCGWLTAATASEYRKILDKEIFLPEILINRHRWDIDAVYIPELEININKETERLRDKLDKHDCVNIFLSEGAGVDAIVSEIESKGQTVNRDAFGHIKLDDGKTEDIKNNRLNELMDVLEEVEGKVIIWANYIYDIEKIVKCIIKKYGEESVVDYYGAIDSETRQKNITEFQDPRSKVRFFVGNPQTGGYGITLTQANTVIYYSNGYDLEKRLQSEDRAHRIGQKKSVTYVDFIAQKTVDEKIVKALRKKIDIASEILGEELRDWI